MKAAKSQNHLGLFPSFDELGGVQASGRLAWTGISQHLKRLPHESQLFCFGKGKTAVSGAPSVITAKSKPAAVLRALRVHKTFAHVLVWHIGLLKLLPFFRLSGGRVVLFLHGIESWREQDLLTRRLLKRVDLFLSNSDYTWNRFIEHYPSYSEVSHCTVPLGIGSPANGSAREPHETPVALMLSRLSKSEDYKGHREVIQAWPLLLSKLPDACLWIAGEGDLKSSLMETAARCGLNGSVQFLGNVSEEAKQELLLNARCLALPSRGEGFGLVYLEAGRVGRPCLVSTIDAGREVVKAPQAGLAVDPSDRSGLVDALTRLLTDGPEWNNWSTQAKLRYESNFTARHFQDRLISALFASEN